MANTNWRTIQIDSYDPDSAPNFPLDSLTPGVAPVSPAEVQTLSSQVKQRLRGGDAEGALRGALENAPYGGDAAAKVRRSPAASHVTRPAVAHAAASAIVPAAADGAPRDGTGATQDTHLATVVEVLQSIKQADMSPMLTSMYTSPGGSDALDVLMKYLYGMPHLGGPRSARP